MLGYIRVLEKLRQFTYTLDLSEAFFFKSRKTLVYWHILQKKPLKGTETFKNGY